MRNDLLKNVQPVANPQQQKPASPPFQSQSETVLVLRVTREDRLKGGQRLSISMQSDKNLGLIPNIKIRPGMRVKITTLPPLPKKNGGGDAKK